MAGAQTEPDNGQLKLASEEQKYYWVNRETFVMIDELIHRKGDGGTTQLVVPETMKIPIMKLNHETPLAGHQGITRTKQKIKTAYFWYRMSKDIQRFITKCHRCNQQKTGSRHNKHPLVQNHAGVPMEKVHMDFVGPLPKSNDGNEHILVMVDNFTKWIEAIPLPSQGAEEMARTAVNEFFSRFGMPTSILTDMGRNFESNLFAELCQLLQITKLRTTPYRPSANGQAERMNRTLIGAVRCLMDGNQKDWDRNLPQITAAIRSSVNRSTGYTPNQMMLGRELPTPAELCFPPREKSKIEPESYVEELKVGMQEAHRKARDILQLQLKRQKREYDLHAHKKSFNKGDAIYMVNSARPNKLSPPWLGPAIIIEVLSPFTYKVKINNNTRKVMHHDKVKKCHDEDIPGWIKKEQMRIENNEPEKFCICRGPDTGEVMVQCDECQEWYHVRCVGISARKAREMARFTCDNCST